MQQTIDLDGHQLPEGRVLGEATWHEETKEWRALMVTNGGALVVAVLNISILDNWYDRVI